MLISNVLFAWTHYFLYLAKQDPGIIAKSHSDVPDNSVDTEEASSEQTEVELSSSPVENSTVSSEYKDTENTSNDEIEVCQPVVQTQIGFTSISTVVLNQARSKCPI